MSYSVVSYTDDRLDDVLDLQAHHWGSDRERNLRYFRWKYEDNPYSDEPQLYLAYDGTAPIGVQGCYGARWVSGAAVAEAYGKGDMVVHPDHRRRGVSQALVDAMLQDQARRGRAGVLATSTTQVAVAGMARTGWWPMPEIDAWRRQPQMLPRRLAFAEAAVRHLLRRAATRIGRTGSSSSGADVLTLLDSTGLFTTDVDAEAMVGVHARREAAAWSHVQDTSWFEWRFANPLATYRLAYLRTGGVDAYLVLATGRTVSDSSVRLVDWAGADDRALEELLGRVAEAIETVTIDLGLADPAPSAFSRSGFFRASRSPLHARPVRLLWYPIGEHHAGGLGPDTRWDWRDIFSDNY